MLGRWVVLRMEMQGVKHSDTIGYREHLLRRRSVFKTAQRSGIFSSEGYIRPVDKIHAQASMMTLSALVLDALPKVS